MNAEPGSATRDLPDELGRRVQTVFGFDHQPLTFADWAESMVDRYESDLDRSLTPDDLCLVESSNHEAQIGDDVRQYQCVLDALIAGYLVDDPVTVRSVPPTSETEIIVEFDDTGLDVDPGGSVMSFGVADDANPPDGPLSPENMYAKLCPYGHAFPSKREYETWAASKDVVATSVPLTDGLAIARELLALANIDDGEA